MSVLASLNTVYIIGGGWIRQRHGQNCRCVLPHSLQVGFRISARLLPWFLIHTTGRRPYAAPRGLDWPSITTHLSKQVVCQARCDLCRYIEHIQPANPAVAVRAVYPGLDHKILCSRGMGIHLIGDLGSMHTQSIAASTPQRLTPYFQVVLCTTRTVLESTRQLNRGDSNRILPRTPRVSSPGSS